MGLRQQVKAVVAVGTALAGGPPHRSGSVGALAGNRQGHPARGSPGARAEYAPSAGQDRPSPDQQGGKPVESGSSAPAPGVLSAHPVGGMSCRTGSGAQQLVEIAGVCEYARGSPSGWREEANPLTESRTQCRSPSLLGLRATTPFRRWPILMRAPSTPANAERY
jgi:hypothetical protein